MKRISLSVEVEVSDSAMSWEVASKVHRILAEHFPGRHVDANYHTPDFGKVVQFHRKFRTPVAAVPSFLDPVALDFRAKFMLEELTEFVVDHRAGNFLKAADALIDLSYVTLGTADMMGLPWALLFDEVQRANMSKELASGADDPRSVRKNSLDIVKPAGWKEPDHSKFLGHGPWPTFQSGAVSGATKKLESTHVSQDDQGRFSIGGKITELGSDPLKGHDLSAKAERLPPADGEKWAPPPADPSNPVWGMSTPAADAGNQDWGQGTPGLGD